MIITQSTPFTLDQVNQLKEEFSVYVKIVVDLEKKVISSGMTQHFEGEKLLLSQGSLPSNIWGGGLDLTTNMIDCISFINARPRDNNSKNEIQNQKIKAKYLQLVKYFFQAAL